MGKEVIRQKDNASDKFLGIVQPLNISKLLQELPGCNAFITTGEKATETLRMHLSDRIKPPKVGESTIFNCFGREFSLYRMPSYFARLSDAFGKKRSYIDNVSER